jgi:hypothetical protein
VQFDIHNKPLSTDLVFLTVQVEEPDFAPFNALYYVGEYINCTANGNPEPTYMWRSIESPMGPDETIVGPQLEIVAEMMGGTNE